LNRSFARFRALRHLESAPGEQRDLSTTQAWALPVQAAFRRLDAMLQAAPASLKRAIGLPHATALVVGTIIGASIFVQPSEITARVPSLPGTLLVWLAAGVLTLLGALVVAELAAAFPASGGVYVYLRELFSPLLAFLWGWAMFWVMHSGILAAIAVVFARYLGYLVPLSPWGEKLAAAGAILALTAVNVLGVRPGSRLQTALTAVKVAAIVLLVLAGALLGPRQGSAGSGQMPVG
jgi:APA family basic amino acid/polyamine antiporter